MFRWLICNSIILVTLYSQESRWTQKSPVNSPPPRFDHAMAYDAARGQVVVFSGLYIAGGQVPLRSDTWVWDGTNWTQKSPAISPSLRGSPAMAYDAARGQVVLFGGYGNISEYGDTWVWDGTNWTQKSPAISPSPRAYSSMAYDAARGQVVLFGGLGERSNLQGDTWVWDGTNWTQRSPAISPSPRAYSLMAYDAARGQVVLFGGVEHPTSGGDNFLKDTWVWDGTNWTQKSPANSPPPRVWSSVAYDAARGQVVLFGGRDGSLRDLLGDTWVWDGTNWTQKSPAISPSLRESHAMAYDAARGQVVLFGGVGSHVDNETWVWPSDPTGGISVTTNLSAASFNISGPVNYSGNGLSFSQVNAPAGTYTINYGSVVGYRPPLSETKTLTNDGSVSFSGTYSNLVGTISISVQPSTATYSVTGPAGFSGFGSAIHKAMPAGQYTVAYSPLVGYLKPPPETKSLSPGGSILFSGTYQLAPGTGSLTIQVSPPTASYRVVGPSSFSGTGNIGPNNTNKYSGLPVGTYTITFLPLIGPAFITPPPKTVLLQANDSPSVIGKYLSSASPPTLKLSACTTPICAAQKITARGPGFVIADVTLSNLTGAWYQLNVQSESTTGSPVRLDAANKLPYAFLISPYKALTFPGIRFETGQYLAINAEKYSVAATSILAIDVILRGLFGVEINGTWEGYLDLQSAVMVEILSSDEVTAPAVAFFVCRDPLCRLEQLADFVFKASNDAKTWNAIKSLISDSKVFGANAARQAEAVRRWTSLGSQSVSTFLSIFNAIGNVQKMSDVWIASLLAPNFGNIRIEAVQ